MDALPGLFLGLSTGALGDADEPIVLDGAGAAGRQEHLRARAALRLVHRARGAAELAEAAGILVRGHDYLFGLRREGRAETRAVA